MKYDYTINQGNKTGTLLNERCQDPKGSGNKTSKYKDIIPSRLPMLGHIDIKRRQHGYSPVGRIKLAAETALAMFLLFSADLLICHSTRLVLAKFQQEKKTGSHAIYDADTTWYSWTPHFPDDKVKLSVYGKRSQISTTLLTIRSTDKFARRSSRHYKYRRVVDINCLFGEDVEVVGHDKRHHSKWISGVSDKHQR